MNIIINDKAADFIRKQSKDNNSVTLLITTSGGGWCAAQVPTVQLGKPTNLENFHIYKVDDITVYLRKNTKVKNNELHVFLRKFLWIKELAVEGMQINF